jgi:acyl-CoA dehydrogenase
MDFEPTDRVLELRARVDTFMDEHILPRELDHGDWVEDPQNAWLYPPWFEDLNFCRRSMRSSARA